MPQQVAVLLGNFNYQVENGGLVQYVDNNFAHSSATAAHPYLALAAVIQAGWAHDPELAAAALAMLRHIHEQPRFEDAEPELVFDPQSETGELVEEPGLDAEVQRLGWYAGLPDGWTRLPQRRRELFMQAVLNGWPAESSPFAAATAARGTELFEAPASPALRR